MSSDTNVKMIAKFKIMELERILQIAPRLYSWEDSDAEGLIIMPKAIHGFVPFLEQEPLSSNARSHVLPVSQFQTNYCGSLVPANEFVFEIKHFYLSHKITHTLEHSDRGLSISPINRSKGPQACSKPVRFLTLLTFPVQGYAKTSQGKNR